MLYASLADLKDGQPTFADTSYSDKTCIRKLWAQAGILKGILAESYTLPVGVAASGTLTFAGNVSGDDTVIAGAKTYTYKASPAAANDVDIGATSTQSAINLMRAIIEGTNGGSYHADTTINVDCYATRSGLVLTVKAWKYGEDGNDLALSTTAANITASAAYLSGGLHEYKVLGQIHEWMTTIILLGGQSNSKLSGKGSRSTIDDAREAIKTALATIHQHGGLIDTEGNILTPLSGAMETDCDDSYPFAGTDDPVYWHNDPDRVPDRE